MTSKWTSNTLPGEPQADSNAPLSQQYAVVQLRGKNSFGDMIYSYVKIFMPNVQKFKAALSAGQGFNPSDFGEVLAAGKGEPDSDLHDEIARLYPFIDTSTAGASASPISSEKKAWDEY